jgi:uncharacterized protein YecE (DUF72 family)
MKNRSVLRENNVALTLTPILPVSEKEQPTADFAYIRWEGNRRIVNGTLGKVEVDRTNDTHGWANSIVELLEKTTQVFGYFSKYYSGHPPTDVKMLLESLKKVN